MAAAATDYFKKASNGTRPVSTQLTAIRAVSASSISCAALTGWPTTTGVAFCIYRVDTSGAKVAGSQTDWVGVVSGTTITNLSLKAGTDVGDAVGAIVECSPIAAWADDLSTGLTTQHTQTGTHVGITTDTLTATGVINTTASGSLQDASIPLTTYRTEAGYDFVASGCVWSGDAYASTRNASMTAGVVYIGGKRVVVSLVTARSFTASKDVYVDVDNTGTLTYTDNTTNAASPALAANSIRLGIIVVGATNIAAATSVNQGQETMVLPIASSIPYAVTDSLGNLICPRDPNRKILGYRQITSNFVLSAAQTTPTQITGLSCPVIVPTGRKVKVTFYSQGVFSAAINNSTTSIWDGVVNAGTRLQGFNAPSSTAGYSYGHNLTVPTTPSTSSKTYNAGVNSDGLNNVTITAAATLPTYIMVELV